MFLAVVIFVARPAEVAVHAGLFDFVVGKREIGQS